MTAGTTAPPSAARARILDTATRLFYAHGLRAVGVDTIIAESGVAKATFYKHFPAKDDLVAAYLDKVDRPGPVSCTPPPKPPARPPPISSSGSSTLSAPPAAGTATAAAASSTPRPRRRRAATRTTAPSRTSRRCWPGCATSPPTPARRARSGSPARSPCSSTARSPTARWTPIPRRSRSPGTPPLASWSTPYPPDGLRHRPFWTKLCRHDDASGPPFRADHVGSLLRPQTLLDARADHAAGEIDDAELRGIEDEAIADVVRMQARRRAADGDRRRVPPGVVAHGLHLRDRRHHQGHRPEHRRALQERRRRARLHAGRAARGRPAPS